MNKVCVCVCDDVCRLIHVFICTGVLPSQYSHFSQFADIGDWEVSAELSSFSENNGVLYFYKLVYQDIDSVGVVSRCTAQSMARAVIEVKALPHYITDGEVFSLYRSHASSGPCIFYHVHVG